MNKFNEMIDHMHMPEEQYEQMKADLMRRTGEKKRDRPVWRRYAVAAALAFCLFGTAITTYAAVRFQWFQIFFDNGDREADIMEEYMAKASTETVTAQDDNYKFTVLNHLYSKEQQMGLALCSFHFLKEQRTHLDAMDREHNTVVLKKNRIIDGQTFLSGNMNNEDRSLHFCVNNESGQETISANMEYFTGEMAEDGGYLIGVRYNFNVEEKLAEAPQLILSLENAGDIDDKLKIRLPESGDVACMHFTSEHRPENSIVISPLGMTLTVTEDKAGGSDNTFDHELLNEMKLVIEGQSRPLADFGEGYSTGILVGDTTTARTWYVQKEFTDLVDVSKISYIELDGEKYRK